MKRIRTRTSPPPVPDLLEEALHLLKRAAWAALGLYLIGTAPFVMGLMWFINDMAHHPRAVSRCAPAALGVAVLFVWCKTWQAGFAAVLRETISGTPQRPWSLRRVRGWLLTQSSLQAPGVLLLPLSALLVLPLPWVLAWFQNLTTFADSAEERLRENASRAWTQLLLWPGQNLLLTLVMAGFALFVAINIACAIITVPLLLKLLLDIDTHVSLSIVSTFNTTFLTVTLGLTWLAVDPVFKAAHVLRCFYGESITTGEDLHVVLRDARQSRSTPALVRAGLVITLLAAVLYAPPAKAAGADSIPRESTPSLDRALDRVLERPEFAWRLMPAIETVEEEPRTVLDQWLSSVREFIFAVGRWVRELGRKVLEWLERAFQTRQRPRPAAAPWMEWLSSPAILISAGILIVLGTLLWLLWYRLRQKPAAETVASAVVAPPDIADENVVADQLPAERWRIMAEELFQRGEARLAIRALYLACLAELGSREVIRISRSKSNLQYVAEVHRRARTEPDRVEAFERLVNAFERVWYGAHAASSALWEEATEESRRVCA